MAERVSVLIVGAGPTGLTLACELARYNIPFRIIDKNLQPVLNSNATWIQTRTIEIFDNIGILDRFLNDGHKCTAINIYSEGNLQSKIDLSSINSEYKFVLQIPQHLTEKILNEYLNESNHYVERQRELIAISPEENGIHALIGHSDGQIESVECDWLIACDGANSTVREKSRVNIDATEIEQKFIVADVKMDAVFNPEEINVFFDAGTVLAVLPMGGYQFRINANLHTLGERCFLNENELRKMISERTHAKARVEEISFISPYVINNILVKNMRKNAIFFAGDAAHIHSPAGGQGMNLGIQDAYNLAWKLALVVKGKAAPSFLDSYHSERYPIANQTVDRTELITKASLIENFFLTDIRNLGIKILNKPIFSKTFGDRIAQLDYEYQNSPIIEYKEKMNAGSPIPGQHAPDVTNNKTTRLYDYLNKSCYNVLIFTRPFRGKTFRIDKNELAVIKKLQQLFTDNFSDLIKIHVITDSMIDNIGNIIFDENSFIYNRYHIKESSVYVIRPDQYIAYCSKKIDYESIKQFFQTNLIFGDFKTGIT